MSDYTFLHVPQANYVLPQGLDLTDLPFEEYQLQLQLVQISKNTCTPPRNRNMNITNLLEADTFKDMERKPRGYLSPVNAQPRSHSTTRKRVSSVVDVSNNENPNSITKICPVETCKRVYHGKNAQSILRRHLKEKHGLTLPRGTRWDNNPNRPKNDEERHQRTLESKRRWAQKQRARKKEQERSANSISSPNTVKAASILMALTAGSNENAYEPEVILPPMPLTMAIQPLALRTPFAHLDQIQRSSPRHYALGLKYDK
ncbi:hypothetical protein G9A89_019953 [Geosiphon pyriformis]|nr:hypothetical protein G9A89_019953 [Geosiphon pyriformis]